MHKKFEGWYFKHQGKNDTLAIIPGRCNDHAFIQIITNYGSHQYKFSSIEIRNHAIYVGNCIFSRHGVELHLPNLKGKIKYGPLCPLSTDIMGPFRFFPMECRHSVISMSHNLTGSIEFNGRTFCFDNGKGYMEADRGTSFPKSYLWLQCNHFDTPCSIMVSIAAIPFYGLHFTGCICAIKYHGKEYRMATYYGVRILAATPKHIRLVQGKLLLEINIHSDNNGFPLRSPKLGQMSGTIFENCNSSVWIKLWDNGRNIINLKSRRASFEFVK